MESLSPHLSLALFFDMSPLIIILDERLLLFPLHLLLLTPSLPSSLLRPLLLTLPPLPPLLLNFSPPLLSPLSPPSSL